MSILLPRALGEEIADGSITVAFRRWKRVGVRPGRVYRTPAGRIEVGAVEKVDPARITDEEAVRAGYADAARARAIFALVMNPSIGSPFAPSRIPILASCWPRMINSDGEAIGQIQERLVALDKVSERGAWTHLVLGLIGERPGVPAGELASDCGMDKEVFKRSVRKLKGLGLTVSLDTGYRLSPRGKAYLAVGSEARE